MKAHSSQKIKICQTCGKKFGLTRSLTRHMKTHEDIRTSFPCPICGKFFTRQEHVRRHIKKVHEKPTATVSVQVREGGGAVGTIRSITQSFSTSQTQTTVSNVSSNIGEAQVVTQASGPVVTTTVTQHGETISHFESRQEAAIALLRLAGQGEQEAAETLLQLEGQGDQEAAETLLQLGE
ncbi:C2H2-type zinc finger protein [Endozoicomonas gorgoniicola]|uniref:C2H2-type zinc finger protein n=2 Tax=Endozoicomonas gorgoniicola TaxID=1234144 RepID=A0ABT3MSZ3_9GAMM|nr:C2H2-type zinc finger protein [Endozoicomonas gorgoniicola]